MGWVQVVGHRTLLLASLKWWEMKQEKRNKPARKIILFFKTNARIVVTARIITGMEEQWRKGLLVKLTASWILRSEEKLCKMIITFKLRDPASMKWSTSMAADTIVATTSSAACVLMDDMMDEVCTTNNQDSIPTQAWVALEHNYSFTRNWHHLYFTCQPQPFLKTHASWTKDDLQPSRPGGGQSPAPPGLLSCSWHLE